MPPILEMSIKTRKRIRQALEDNFSTIVFLLRECSAAKSIKWHWLRLFLLLCRSSVGSGPLSARFSIDMDRVTAKRRVRFIGTSHVTGSSSRRNSVRQARRILAKAWNWRSGETNMA